MNKHYFFIVFITLLSPVVQGQVNYFTKVLKPELKYDFPLDENRYNSCITDTKDDHWIVFSLEGDNQAYKDHYGQYPESKLDFLTPCYVIDEKNGFLELVKYNKDLLPAKKGMLASVFSKNNKRYRFKDASQAEYVGWVPRTKLLQQNIAWNGNANLKPLRYWTGISNPDLLLNRDHYFVKDTLKLFQDPNLSIPMNDGVNILIGDIVYVYRQDEEKGAMLIGKNATFSADTTLKMLGWVDEKVLTTIGQQKVMVLTKNSPIQIMKKLNDAFFDLKKGALKDSPSDVAFFFNRQIHLSPFEETPESTPILLPSKVWDHSPNKVLNINGEFIDQGDFNVFKSKSRKLNIFFVFEKTQSLRFNLLRLTNNIQKIWEILQKEQFQDYEVTFNAMSYTQSSVAAVAPEHKNFVKWLDFIHDEIESEDSVTEKTSGLQEAILKCGDMLKGREQESNVLIVAGSNAYSVDNDEIEQLSTQLAKSFTRILFWKVQNDISEESTNFILFAKAMLYKVGHAFSVFKRHYIADFNLYHESNMLKLINEINNVYLFDSPAHSMYQGGVAFPKINEEFHPILFEQILDSLLLQVAADNDSIITSLNSYFTGVGLARSIPDSELKATLAARNQWNDKYQHLPTSTYQDKYWANYYGNTDSLSLGFDNYYLISDGELKTIINNIKALAPKLPIEFTWFFRRRLFRTHKRFSKRLDQVFCYEGDVGRIPLQELLFMSNGIRTMDSEAYDIRINHIKSNQKLSDDELEKILVQLRDSAIQLEEFIIDNPEMSVQYQSQKYFLIPEDLLP